MIYILKASISADNNETVPGVRLRVQADDNVWSANAIYSGTAPGMGGNPQITPSDFFLIWQPQFSTSDAFVAVDMFSGTDHTGVIYVDDISVYRIPIPAAEKTEKTITDFSTNWLTLGGMTNVHFGQYITIDDTATWSTAGSFNYLIDPIAPGSVYRLRYTVSKTGSASNDQIRLRTADTYNGYYSNMIVFSNDIQTAPQEMVAYHYGTNTRDSVNGDISVFFDTIHRVTGSPSIILSKLIIEKIVLPDLQ